MVASRQQRMDKYSSSSSSSSSSHIRPSDEELDEGGLTSLDECLVWRNVLGSLDDFTPALMSIYDSLCVDTQSDSQCSEISPECGRLTADQRENVMAELVSASAVSTSSVDTSSVITSSVSTPDVTCNTVSAVSSSDVSTSLPENLLVPADTKKRPLSVSSTSSSNSSTSSLTRHHHKRVAATAVTTSVSMTTASIGDAHMDTGRCDSMEKVSDNADKTSSDEKLTSNDSKLFCDDNVIEESTLVDDDNSGLSFIDKVLAEILSTERTYVQDLRDIVQGYLSYFCQSPQLLLSAENVTTLFGNIEDIYQLNKIFLAELEKCDCDAAQVAQCFVNHKDGFSIYANYCTNYPKSVDMLVGCMRNADLAEVFKQLQLQLGHGLPLGAYLLKPIQRILKYHLLLQKIVNNYEERDDVYVTLTLALSSMMEMAEHINKMKGKHEHAVHVQEIQSVLYGCDGDDLTTYGDLILEGSFRMSGVRGCRWLFLFEKALLIAKKEKDGSLIMKASIKCANLMLIESIPKEPLSFHMIPFDNPRGQHTAQAADLSEKRKWCDEMKRLILENYPKAIPDNVKQLVMKLGKNREEDAYSNSNADSPSRKHSALEYLERRRGVRRKSTGIIPDFAILKPRRGARKSPPTRRRSDITRPTFTTQRSEPVACISEEISEVPYSSDQSRVTITQDGVSLGDNHLDVPPSPVKRESFRRATSELNRVDSITLARQRRDKTKSADNSTRPISEFKDLLPSAITRSSSAGQIGVSACQPVSPLASRLSPLFVDRHHSRDELRKACLANRRVSPIGHDATALYDNFCTRVSSDSPQIRSRLPQKTVSVADSADPWVRQPEVTVSSCQSTPGTLVFADRMAYVTTETSVARDHATDRAICRLATPPRQMLNDLHLDLVSDLATVCEQRRIISRLGTPPRASVNDGAIYVNRSYVNLEPEKQEEKEERRWQRRYGRDHSSQQQQHDVWAGIDGKQHMYGKSKSADESSRLESSPSLIGDGLVFSLRNAVTSFTSRLRTKSTSALDAAFAERKTNAKERRNKRYQFLSQLAKVYSERTRRQPQHRSSRRPSAEALSSLLHAQGGSVIGARMAEPTTPTGNTYTLRDGAPFPRDIGPSRSCSSSSIESVPGAPTSKVRTGYDSGCAVQDDRPDEPVDLHNLCDVTLNQLGMSEQSLDGSDSDSYDDEDDENFQSYYYESRFLADLEASLCCDDVFRDSAIYSDDGTKPDEDNDQELIDDDAEEEEDADDDEDAVVEAGEAEQYVCDGDSVMISGKQGDMLMTEVHEAVDITHEALCSAEPQEMAPVFASSKPPPLPPGRRQRKQNARPPLATCAAGAPQRPTGIVQAASRQPERRWYLTYAYRPTQLAPLPKVHQMSATKKGFTL